MSTTTERMQKYCDNYGKRSKFARFMRWFLFIAMMIGWVWWKHF